MSCLLLPRCPLPPHSRWITKGLTWVNAYRSCFLINLKKLPRWLWHASVLLSTYKSHWPPPPGEMRKTAHNHTAKCEASWALPSSVLFLTEHSSHCKRGDLGGCHTVKSIQREDLTGFPKRKTEKPNRADIRSALSYLWSNYICYRDFQDLRSGTMEGTWSLSILLWRRWGQSRDSLGLQPWEARRSWTSPTSLNILTLFLLTPYIWGLCSWKERHQNAGKKS